MGKGVFPNGPIEARKTDIKVAVFEIENEETFHLKELYKYIHDYIDDDEGFKSPWGDDRPEILYFERQQPSGSREHHMWWRYLMAPNGSTYFRYVLKVDFQSLAMGKKEVIKDGQKLKLDSGDLIIRIQAFLQLDYNDEWEKHWFLKRMHQYFQTYMYRSQIDYYKIDLYKTAYRIQSKIKQFLQLTNYGPMQPPIQPVKGMR